MYNNLHAAMWLLSRSKIGCNGTCPFPSGYVSLKPNKYGNNAEVGDNTHISGRLSNLK